MVSYIFDNDFAGHAFREALVRARDRGVEVRVLIDDVGSRYTKPTMVHELREAGVRVAAFLPTRVPRLFQYANLRNHRKIMVVDGCVGFTGGMNIRAGHWRGRDPDDPVRCVHVPGGRAGRGRHAGSLRHRLGVHDGRATGGRALVCARAGLRAGGGSRRPGRARPPTSTTCRNCCSAPWRWRRGASRVTSPYFLPDDGLLRALQVAALRGVQVDILLPEHSNVPLMDWAVTPQLPWLLDAGCRCIARRRRSITASCWSWTACGR